MSTNCPAGNNAINMLIPYGKAEPGTATTGNLMKIKSKLQIFVPDTDLINIFDILGEDHKKCHKWFGQLIRLKPFLRRNSQWAYLFGSAHIRN